MRLGLFTGATATTTLVLGAMVSLAPGQNTGEVEAPTPPAKGALKFNHQAHAALDTPINECRGCHGEAKDGSLRRPAEVGHQPCFSSGCHAEDFLSVGSRTRKAKPERYAKAAAFCQGCHQSKSGQAPSPYIKAKADNLYRNNASPSHYLEMNHYEHTQKTACRTCHVVDENSFALDLETPGHDQCATCHKDNEELGMPQCASCHLDGAPATYYKERKFTSDVRSCNSQRLAALKKKRNARELPCFEHEHEGHRTRKNGDKVQCGDCHFMFQSKSYAGHSYQSLQDIKQAPLMDNRQDRAHKKCGTSGCHRAAVDESSGSGKCAMCHSSQSILQSLTSGPATPAPQNQGDKGERRERKSDLDSLTDDGSSSSRRKRRRKKGGGSLNDLVD